MMATKTHNTQYPIRLSLAILTMKVPDEEVGGGGMLALISSALFKSLPGIALALDEGLASTDETYSLFYGERLPWWIDVTAHGKTGHGSRFIDETAGENNTSL
jgi:aminoacylase